MLLQERRVSCIPEGPELKHSRDFLRNYVVGEIIHELSSLKEGRYSKKDPDGLADIRLDFPVKITGVDTKGKFMWWTLEGKTKKWFMWCTYGMSGQWMTKNKVHSSFLVNLGQKKIYFVDARRFGTIKFTSNSQDHAKKLSSLGPDILDDTQFTPEIFAKNMLGKPNRIIAEALMDQQCVAGVGNYLRAEALYDSKIDPMKSAVDMNAQEYLSLHASISKIAKQSYAAKGASIKTYRNSEDSSGEAQFTFKVYGRKTDDSGNVVVRTKDSNGRTIHWCPSIQK